DLNIAALDIASFAQPLAEGGNERRPRCSRCAVEKSDYRHRRRLRPHRSRPQYRRAAKQCISAPRVRGRAEGTFYGNSRKALADLLSATEAWLRSIAGAVAAGA